MQSNNKKDGNASRENIKMNTKNLMHEISDLDQEIAQLQGTLISALQPNIMMPHCGENNIRA